MFVIKLEIFNSGMGVQTKWMTSSYKAIKFHDIFTQTKASLGVKGDKPRTEEGRWRNGCFHTERRKWKPNKKYFQSNGGQQMIVHLNSTPGKQ